MSESESPNNSWPHRCKNCQAIYFPDDWENAKYVGIHSPLSEKFEIEFRVCGACGSTMKQLCPFEFIEIENKV